MQESYGAGLLVRLGTMTKREQITNYDALWDSYRKCKVGVSWKPAAKHFYLNDCEEILRMAKKLETGSWVNGTPRPIRITYPKKRDGLSIPFKDRVYQRSINDNALYPAATRSFIHDNAACQKGKGPDRARKRIKKMLWRFYCNHGLNGYVCQIDISGYYKNMRHDVTNRKLQKCLANDEVYKMVVDVLDTQYTGNVGYNPGSQMVQIAGIAVPDELDHYIKEKLHIKNYIRYMDDFWILHEDVAYLRHCMEAIREKLGELGFEANKKKTHITSLRNGFKFLGFEYRMTETGKIVMTLNSDNVRAERRRLRRLVILEGKGEKTRGAVDEHFRCWCDNASHGNSYKLTERMRRYYKSLRREYLYGTQKNENGCKGSTTE